MVMALCSLKQYPLLMPKTFNVWGHAGTTGAYLFYHPKLDTYLIGTFHDFSYERKGVRFMLIKVVNQLIKIIMKEMRFLIQLTGAIL